MGWCSINSLCLLQNFIWWQKSSGRQVLRCWPSLKTSSWSMNLVVRHLYCK